MGTELCVRPHYTVGGERSYYLVDSKSFHSWTLANGSINSPLVSSAECSEKSQIEDRNMPLNVALRDIRRTYGEHYCSDSLSPAHSPPSLGVFLGKLSVYYRSSSCKVCRWRRMSGTSQSVTTRLLLQSFFHKDNMTKAYLTLESHEELICQYRLVSGLSLIPWKFDETWYRKMKLPIFQLNTLSPSWCLIFSSFFFFSMMRSQNLTK